jgi:hypothetical protein
MATFRGLQWKAPNIISPTGIFDNEKNRHTDDTDVADDTLKRGIITPTTKGQRQT